MKGSKQESAKARGKSSSKAIEKKPKLPESKVYKELFSYESGVDKLERFLEQRPTWFETGDLAPFGVLIAKSALSPGYPEGQIPIVLCTSGCI